MSWIKYKKSIWKAYRRIRCFLLGGHKILIIGDSHAGVFEYAFDHDLLAPHLLNCDIVGGATASGLNNDKSVTSSFSKFQASIRRFADYDVVVIMLGEVDCSFALWNRAKLRGESVFEQIPHAVKGVERLLDWSMAQLGRRNFVLAGSILPTIKDEQIDLQYYELRRSVRATQRERSDLVLALNDALRKLAGRRGLHYVDITSRTIDAEQGVVREQFIVAEKLDHHQSQAGTAPLWVEEMTRVLLVIERGQK
jgi:hypothetical protein